MGKPDRRYIEHILRGEYDRANMPPPHLKMPDFEGLAQAAHEAANRPRPFPPGRHLARALKLELLPRAPSGLCGEGTTGKIIAFDRCEDPRDTELNVIHGLSHAILRSESGACTDTDAWLLTGCLVIRRRVEHIARARPELPALHFPDWLVMERLIQLSVCRDYRIYSV